jgi:hypothetical protein
MENQIRGFMLINFLMEVVDLLNPPTYFIRSV